MIGIPHLSIGVIIVLTLAEFHPAFAQVFDRPELRVVASPEQAAKLSLDDIEAVMDLAVSPAGSTVAVLAKLKTGEYCLGLWEMGTRDFLIIWKLDAGSVGKAVAWQPEAKCLFLATARRGQHQILRLEFKGTNWEARSIYRTPHEIRRLVSGPCPFVVKYGDGQSVKEELAFRVFFGLRSQNGAYRTVSITEEGQRFYQVIGPAKTRTPGEEPIADPSHLNAPYALPVAFHPSGHQLIWEDRGRNFLVASYQGRQWGSWKDAGSPAPPRLFGGATKRGAIKAGVIKAGTLTCTPNGLGFIQWKSGEPGVKVHFPTLGMAEQQATDIRFLAKPCAVPDGRGIVGVVRSGATLELRYVPLRVPLPDVVNAWMFAQAGTDADLLTRHGGLFRTLTQDQLYELYDSESYYCGTYGRNTPTRPYLVTTDIFWEVFAAAFEGMFIVKERETAIPAFWAFVEHATEACQTGVAPKWKPAFQAIADLRAGQLQNPESARIAQAAERGVSTVSGQPYDFGELKPRSHYAATPESRLYFQAFRYLVGILAKDQAALRELQQLPPETRTQALRWIGCYQDFISAARTRLVWEPENGDKNGRLSFFPLSWGIDNVILDATVFHPDLPEDQRIEGPKGPRMLPTGLDVASVLGSSLAETLLEPELQRYPPLRGVIDRLKKEQGTPAPMSEASRNLYDRWMAALSLQWADLPASGDIWPAKRLQTGLASWATLRHATLLVNERTVTECGEGGFEEIVLRAPRGYVEPDPRTFSAIAGLFETLAGMVDIADGNGASLFAESDVSNESLRQGIIRRLKESANKARMFKSMAEKELAGEPLTQDEYEEILYVGRVAEHHFLIFKSMASPDYALSTPDPVMKVADVAGTSPYLLAAVGRPLQWEFVVPFFGRRQVVKGSAYAYYEMVSERLLTDAEWRERLIQQSRPPWLTPFFSYVSPTYPPTTGWLKGK